MFALKEAEDRLRKTEYAKENLARDLERQTNKVQMIEKNQDVLSIPYPMKNILWEKVLDNTDPDNPVMVDSNVQMKTLGLKSNMVSQVKHTAGTILANTDWYVVRKSEKGVDIPVDVEAKRDAVRTECDRLEAAIAAVTTVEELISVMHNQNWGE